MDGAFAFAVAVGMLHLLLLHTSHCGAARPLRYADSEMSTLALAPAYQGAAWKANTIAGAGKWLPMPGGVLFPATPAGAFMPWAMGALPALAGPGGQLVPPYIGATRQEQLSMWASLFNPVQRPTVPAVGESVDGEAKMPASGRAPDVDVPGAVHIGEPRWGLYVGNTGN